MTISEAIYHMGVRLRNPKIPEHFSRLKKSESWSEEQIHEWQSERLRQIIEHAERHSPYYGRLFAEFGVTARTVQSVDDIVKFPIIDKADLLVNASDIQVDVPLGKLFYSETSGSTGQPLVFYRDEAWDAAHRAAILRGYSWYDVHPWDRNGYFWGFDFRLLSAVKTRFFDSLQNRVRLFAYDRRELEAFYRRLRKAEYVEGYSSMIFEMAKFINANDSIEPLQLKLVKGTSERIHASYHAEAERAFGRKITSEYGAAEAGIIAFEAPDGKMYETSENVILEEVENQAVVTNLWSKSFPIIRYRIGDYIRTEGASSSNFMPRKSVVDVMGRIGEVIYGFRDTYPSLTLYYVFKNLASKKGIVINYQGVQHEVGHLQLKMSGQPPERHLELVRAEATRYFGDDVTVELMCGWQPELGKTKRKDFIPLPDKTAQDNNIDS